ncbi:MAG: hypothetical protein Fur0042_09220 [Cyanophyceae cyanobacterium]
MWGLGAIAPGAAHTVQRAGNVAVTFHIEPNHNPRSGEPSKAWFVLTRPGGNPIALEECDCVLSVHPLPRRPGDRPESTPPLAAINAETFRAIPGATVTFARSGAYELVLTGQPRSPDGFTPFSVSYGVTVLGGANRAAASPTPTTTVPPDAETIAATESTSRANPLSLKRILPSLAVPIAIAGALTLAWRHWTRRQ